MYKRYSMLGNLASEGIEEKNPKHHCGSNFELNKMKTSESDKVEGNSGTEPSLAMLTIKDTSGPERDTRMEEKENGSDRATSKSEEPTADDDDSPKTKKVYKSHKTSIVIIPPEECWKQIQEIRSVYDKAYKRWMPHINMIYPFIPHNNHEEDFEEAAKKIHLGLEHFQPFRISFPKEAFGYFPRRKNTTMWLKPLLPMLQSTSCHINSDIHDDGSVSCSPEEAGGALSSPVIREVNDHHQEVIELQAKLVELFPDFSDLNTISDSGFQPHLSLGQFRPKVVNEFVTKFQESWEEISFDVKEIYLISRVDFDDPFHIRHRIPLGTKI